MDGSRWPDVRPWRCSFFGAPICEDLERLDAQVVFIGVPFDQGTTNRPGARFGPHAVRQARVYDYFSLFEPEPPPAGGLYEVDVGTEILKGVTMADLGDINVAPSNWELALERLTRVVSRVIEKGAFPVVVGGDHTITFPVVRALERFAPLGIVHLDAHLDYTHDYQGVRYYHGSPIRRCAELPFVGPISHIGIRAVRRKPVEEARQRGNLIISADRFRALGPKGAAALVPSSAFLYISLDIDVLDPAVAPGTGTPVVGGLTYLEVRDFLREVARKGKVVGCDVVEVAPEYDHAQITALAASRLIVDILAAVFPPHPQP
ncbi:MAG: agmatinase [Dehalococcoidia bacterium]|nr:agmatinase [Dehalococcoidia bacterium]MDW8119436.1 agmatinase [Chloroflexota bacterium]